MNVNNLCDEILVNKIENHKYTEYYDMQIKSKDDQFGGHNILTFCRAI